jgi:hypothetical protein
MALIASRLSLKFSFSGNSDYFVTKGPRKTKRIDYHYQPYTAPISPIGVDEGETDMKTRGWKNTIFGLEVFFKNSPCTPWQPPENRNQDRSQSKPLRRRNSDLLTDSVAISIQYYTPTNPPLPLHTYIARKRDLLGEGGYRQMYAAESVNRLLFLRRKGLHWLLSWFLFSGSPPPHYWEKSYSNLN